MNGCESNAVYGSGGCRKSGLIVAVSLSSTGGRLKTVISSLLSLLILFVIVSVTESVPTQDFREGQKEVVDMSEQSLYWPYSLHQGEYNGLDNFNGRTNERLFTGKRSVQPIQLCGYRLLEAVRGLCRGNFVGLSKRSDPDMEDDRHMTMADSPVDSSILSESFHPHRHHESQQSGRHQHLRFRRTIIDECCMKACSVNEMLRYCGRN